MRLGGNQIPGMGGVPDPELKVDPEPEVEETPVYDRSEELRNFMYAIHRYGGGGWAGSKGGYMFQAGQWGDLSTAAGLKGANMSDRTAQTYVAAFWMDRLYKQYRNWGLVAVAWKNGAGAAGAIIKQSGKKPAAVTMDDIKSLSPDVFGFVGEVTKWSTWAQQKGGIPEDVDPNAQPKRVVVSGTPISRTTITGMGVSNVEDPYQATMRALYDESKLENKARQLSGAEMLFTQLETLSNVVSGGDGRVDWRHAPEETGSGGEVKLLDPIGSEDEETR